ncbi:glycoside hydrolase family 3 protein [Pseudoalteromonas aurantia]|uniref:Beta-glucosidase n=1 Tax=Pseudoalteromonas aurantia TaxID=43654 RepID=A0ABY2W2H0_9GAMM|nr:exo 1,3/1,4-beta-D-glucan glucohydrolase [Pseudoalteromonas aurantia]TMO78321.1 beta-glucosidase [Pseudoalteromonas aurantia]
MKMTTPLHYISVLLMSLSTLSCTQHESQTTTRSSVWPTLHYKLDTNSDVEQQVESILAQMTLEQKIAQMIQPEIRDITVEDMRRYGFGSYLNGGGAFPNNNKHASAADWVNLAEQMYQASIDDSLDGSKIPTMWGTDAVHGHNNVIGATLFPHNIGLGAANNPDLIEKIAQITAKEVMATGIDWVFAPTVAVVRDDRWGRTYEGYSEDPVIVGQYASAIVTGLQGKPHSNFLGDEQVISTVKHFLGDGGTVGGDDQGNNIDSEQTLFDIHAQGYVHGLSAGAQTVMASFNSWHGDKIHGNKYLLTDVLKQKMGFDGFVVGDWNGHGQVQGCSNESCSKSINAGLDMFMVPTKAWKPLLQNTLAQVQQGEIALSRIDDAVSRILRVKVRAGLFTKPSPAKRVLAGKQHLIGHTEHRKVAKQAVRESLVLLKNNQQTLPLKPSSNILLAGDGADNISKQSGGWSITWQGTGNTNKDFPGGSSVYDGVLQHVSAAGGKVTLSPNGEFSTRPDVVIMVFGENPYAEGNGDLNSVEYQKANKRDLALLKKFKLQGLPVVSVFLSGRPLWVNPELNHSDAFVAAWLPGSEGSAIADVLFKTKTGTVNYDFTGKLSFSWPAQVTDHHLNVHDAHYSPLFAFGYGLTYRDNVQVPHLDTTIAEPTAGPKIHPILQGTVKSPWTLNIVSQVQRKQMSSNAVALDAIQVRTIDKNVQEDARQITFSQAQPAKVAISHVFPEDLRDFTAPNSALMFDIKVSNKAGFTAKFGINCDENCSRGIPLANVVNTELIEQWQSTAISTKCFSHVTAFASVFSPFAIAAEVDTTISLANIRLVHTRPKAHPMHHCP